MNQDTYITTSNPLFSHQYTADPCVLVHGDRLYLYTGHDEAPEGTEDYLMNDWLCFSTADLHTWQQHPHPLKATDFSWVKGDAYASKVIAHNGRFYWYVAVTPKEGYGKAIGVAISDTPYGPFRDAIGAALITHDMLPGKASEKANLDPTVLIDKQGQAHMWWGNGACYYARLTRDMTALDGPITILDLPGFAEGACVHERNGWYYLSYGYGFPEKVAYCMSRQPEGPWEFKGILNEIAGNCETNRPAIIDFKGTSYFFYHNGALPKGGSHRRSVCIDYLRYHHDGSMQRVIMTTEGVPAL